MTTEEFMRRLLTDATVGSLVRATTEAAVHHVEDVRANPDVEDFSACTVATYQDGAYRLTVTRL